MKKARAGRTPSVANRTRSTSGTKRKVNEMGEDTSVHTPVAVLSGDEGSELGLDTPAKRVKREVQVRDEFVDRYVDKAIGSRIILLGKPVQGKFLMDSGALTLFSKLGMSEFLTDLPNVCYSELVREFYANLHVDSRHKFVSFVSGIKINMNSVILGEILGVKSVDSVSIYKRRGSVNLEGFPAISQLRVVRGLEELEEFVTPTTAQVLPMAHLLFRICISNICPRMGTKSNFSCQDLTVVAMLMSGKGFDLCDLILNNMMEVHTGSVASGLPYGLLLTKIFEFYGVPLNDEEKVSAKDFLDAKGFGQSGLVINKDGQLVQIEEPAPTPVVKDVTSPKNASKFVTLEAMDMLMEEVRVAAKEAREFAQKVHEESAEFSRKLDMVVSTLKLKKVTPDQLDALVKAAARMLEDGDDKDEDSPVVAPAVPVAPAREAVEDADEAVES